MAVLTARTPDGLIATHTYDDGGRLLEVAHVTASATLSRFTYGLDAAGRRTNLTTRQGATGYAYDDRGQLTEACFGACPGQPAVPQLPCLACVGNPLARPTGTAPNAADTFIRYTYDAVGNRLTETTHLGTSISAYDLGDRLTSVTAPGGAVTNYTYDANGNQTAAGARTYTYDAADRMTSARVGTTTESYTWSGDGLRLSASTGSQSAKTTRYVWDRNFGLAQLAIERNGSGTTLRSYAYALDLLSQAAGSATFYYHHDALGSVADVTSATGTPLAWYEYDPFGELRASGTDRKAPVNRFQFTGEYLDPFTGLYHLRARQYDPGLGRFLSQDPVAPTLEDPYVASYVYVANAPLTFTDPSGKCFILCGAAVGAVVGGLVSAGSYLLFTPAEERTLGGFLGNVAVGAASGAVSGMTLGLASGVRVAGAALPAFERTIMQATGGYVSGIVGAAGATLMGERVTPLGFAVQMLLSISGSGSAPRMKPGSSFLDQFTPSALFGTPKAAAATSLAVGSGIIGWNPSSLFGAGIARGATAPTGSTGK